MLLKILESKKTWNFLKSISCKKWLIIYKEIDQITFDFTFLLFVLEHHLG